MNVYQKYAKVRDSIEQWVLDKKHPHFGYKYVSGKSILDTLKPLFKEVGLLAFMTIVPNSAYCEPCQTMVATKNKTNNGDDITTTELNDTSSITLWLFKSDIVYKIIDTETGEFFEIPFYATATAGAGSAQAYGSALTYAERYFWLKELGIPSDELDPDAGFGDPKPTAQTNNEPIKDNKKEVIDDILVMAQDNAEFYNTKVLSTLKGKSLEQLPLAVLKTIQTSLKKESAKDA